MNEEEVAFVEKYLPDLHKHFAGPNQHIFDSLQDALLKLKSGISEHGSAPINDSDIPKVYGTVEVREAVKTAREGMTNASELLQKLNAISHIPELDAFSEKLLYNFRVLNDAFGLMQEKMEPEIDEKVLLETCE